MKQLSSHELHFSRPAPGGGENDILIGIDVSFSAGEIALVSGATGAGKSSLLYVFAGLARPTSGEVRSDGVPVSRWAAAHRDLWRRRTGFVFQHACLMRGITPLENVMLPLIPRSMGLSEMRKAGMSALESIEAGDLAGKRTGALSGGERQKIAIARGLSGNPEVLFADEPTAHQDDASAARILKVLKACSGRGCIVIVASHDRRVRESGLIDRIHLLDHGRIGTAEWCLTL